MSVDPSHPATAAAATVTKLIFIAYLRNRKPRLHSLRPFLGLGSVLTASDPAQCLGKAGVSPRPSHTRTVAAWRLKRVSNPHQSARDIEPEKHPVRVQNRSI